MRSVKGVVLEIAALAASVAALWLCVARPLFAESSQTRDQLAVARRELQEACDLTAHVGAATERTPSYAARVRELEAMVPTGSEASDLFRRMRARAVEDGLRVVADRPAAVDATGDLVHQRKTWLVEGSYSAIVAWLDWIETEGNHRLLSIPSLSLRRAGARGLVRGDVTVDVITRGEGRSALAAPLEGHGR